LQRRGKLKCINNGKKFGALHDDENKARMKARWFRGSIRVTGHHWLQDINYGIIDQELLYTFVERWHEETSRFYLSMEEMTITLDDVSCLLHLPIKGMLLDHDVLVSRTNALDMMVEFLGLMRLRLWSRWKIQLVLMHVLAGWERFSRSVFRRYLRLRRLVIYMWCSRSGTNITASICSIWWVSCYSQTRAQTMWLWHTWGSSDTWSLHLIMHGEQLHLHTCTWSLTMPPIIRPNIWHDSWYCCRYK